MKEKSSTFLSWVELFRVPNLLTVPGDPLAGVFVAIGPVVVLFPWRVALLPVGASLAWYAMGLLTNDLADFRIDLQERPRRPLPSGRVRPGSAVVMSAVLLVAGFLCAAAAGTLTLKIGLGLVSAILLYNFLLKRIPIIGELNMGLCRGLSLLLGASAAAPLSQWPVSVWGAAAGLTVYIMAVTALARHECGPKSWIRPALIGTLISLLLFLQAGIILAVNRRVEGVTVAVVLALLWPLNRYLGQRFSGS
jgi:4-hydroxybenzoate polyprenyltransferase